MTTPTDTSLQQQLTDAHNNLELAQETISQLELAVDDVGWRRLTVAAEREFTRAGLLQVTAVCRLLGLANPLIKRGLKLREVYIWGQGVEVSARANGKRGRRGEQDVNGVLQTFMDDPGNRRVLFGAEAAQRLERTLGTDGNIFFSLWTKPASGRVQVRLLPWDEIVDVVVNPEDSSEPWFYHRRWHNVITGSQATQTPGVLNDALYPALTYRPKSRPKTWNGIAVRWDAPVRHVKVNELSGWKFGVPDAYAAIDWARAYKDFLEDWARLVKSLSRFAWRATAAGSKQAQAIKAKIAAPTPFNPVTGAHAVGEAAVIGQGQILEAIPKTGATIDSMSGRPLAMMVAAALGVPVTMLLADPGQTGARATAETLDQPTELEMASRQSVWADVLRDMCGYVVRESVRAPNGTLRGKIVVDLDGGETVVLNGRTEQTIDVAWPDIKDLHPSMIIAAITQASQTGVIPPEIILRLLLTALGVKAVDEIVDSLVDKDGTFVWPEQPPSTASTPPGVAPPAAGDSTPDDTTKPDVAPPTD